MAINKDNLTEETLDKEDTIQNVSNRVISLIKKIDLKQGKAIENIYGSQYDSLKKEVDDISKEINEFKKELLKENEDYKKSVQQITLQIANNKKLIEKINNKIIENKENKKSKDFKFAFINGNEVQVGSIIEFGTYPQTSDGKDKTPIKWRVLSIDGNKALIITERLIECITYNESGKATWDTCSLRDWLNETFLNIAFSAKEQALIQNTTVSADKNPNFGTYTGNATTDKVFLLSIKELEKYFASDEDRKGVPTEYAIKHGAYYFVITGKTKDGESTCQWWLRSPGRRQNYAARVYIDGSVDCDGSLVDSDYGCVRPALWINLDS